MPGIYRLAQSSALILTLLVGACSDQRTPATEAPKKTTSLTSDVRTLCADVEARYAYFEERANHWGDACKTAVIRATSLEGKAGSLAILETLVDDLYDPHISLNTNTQSSPRLIPSGADLRVEQIGDAVFIIGVRPGSGAANAGVFVGDEVVSFNGLELNRLAETRIHSGLADATSDRRIWAINAAIAGQRDQPRNIEVRRGETILTFSLGTPEPASTDMPITYRTIGDQIGYIRVNNRLGDTATVEAFDVALETLRSTDGLILDLRSTPGGGGTNVAEPIMGRFIEAKTAYQTTVYPNGRMDERAIRPVGPWTYDKRLVVLVGPWTGSMGEGMAIGFDGMERGQVIGSPMAGLAGGADQNDQIRLDYTGVLVWIPTYDLRHIDGTPRHEWLPPLAGISDNGNESDLLLEKALEILRGK